MQTLYEINNFKQEYLQPITGPQVFKYKDLTTVSLTIILNKNTFNQLLVRRYLNVKDLTTVSLTIYKLNLVNFDFGFVLSQETVRFFFNATNLLFTCQSIPSYVVSGFFITCKSDFVQFFLSTKYTDHLKGSLFLVQG
jgi:hypothetical protein